MRDTDSHIDDGEQSGKHSRQFDTRASRRAFLKTTAGTVAVGVAGESVAAAEGPTLGVDLSSDQIDVGGTSTGTVTLSSAPSGLSGFELEITVDSSVATIADATYDDAFGLSDGPQIASDGSSVTLQAVDVQDNVSGSAGDIPLATITLTGEADGETDVGVASGSADADGGAAIGPATSATTLTVGTGGTGGGNTDTGSGGTDGGESGGGNSQYPAWDPNTVYRSGDRVVYEGTVWEAQWYSTDDEPRDEDYYVWEKIGPATGSGGSDDDGADRGQGDDETDTDQGDTGGGDDALTVSATLSTDGIQAGRTTEVSIQLSNAPDGLAGYAVDVTVDDPSIATVTDASYANAFGLTSEAQIEVDGSSVRLEAADVQDAITAGASNVELATVTLAAQSGGTTDVDVSVPTLDDDSGGSIDATTTGDSLTVSGGTTGSQAPGVPQNLSVLQTTQRTVKLSWNAPSGDVDHYTVYRDGEQVEQIWDGSTQSTVTGLEAGTRYEIAVTAVGPEGDESDRATVTATTESESIGGSQIKLRPTLAATDIAADGTTTASIVLSSAPEGVAGFTLDVGVADSSVATITDATYDDAFGLTSDASIAGDGSSVSLKATDIQDTVTAGASDVTLATVTLAGESAGQTNVTIDVDTLDTDDGALIDATTDADTLTVDGGRDDSGNNGGDQNEGDDQNDENEQDEEDDQNDGGVSSGVGPVLSRDSIQAGQTTEASIRMADAPNGLAGYALEVSVDPAVATVSDASYANAFGLTSDAQIAGDGSSVRFEAADVQDNVTPGDTDVELATVTLSGDGAGTTSVDVTVETLDADDGSTISARATSGTLSVDGDTGDSEPTEDEEADDGEDSSSADALVVNDYDGSPGWPGQNDLGNWCGAGSFGNAGVSDGALVLEYDNSGWLIEKVNRDVSEYSKLVVRLKGSSGGEGSHFTVSAGGSSNVFANVANGSVSTSHTNVAVDLDAAGISGSLGQLRLEFWQGGSGTLSIEEIRLE